MRLSHIEFVLFQGYTHQKQAFLGKFEQLLHHSAQKDELTLHRHKSFIQSHLLGGLLALMMYPLYLYRTGSPSLLDVLIIFWFSSPIATVYYLCRTGNLAIAHMISSLNLAIFVTVGALLSGGINSFLIAWMVIVPLEAALSGRKKIIFLASFFAAAMIGGLYLAGIYGFLPTNRSFIVGPEALMLFGIFSATTYGSAIAMSVQRAHEQSELSIRQSEQKYRLMADNVTDMISVHDEHGLLTFASPASGSIFGVEPEDLFANGLLKKIHISDRPLYMTALSNCRNDQHPVSVEFRVKRPLAGNPGEGEPVVLTEYIWVEMRCRLVEDGNEQAPAHIIAVTRDITSNKTQEITLLKARDEAESANIAKTRFLANMSHELRTPLNAIIGFSDVLNMELFGKIGNEKYSDYSRLINEAGIHLLSVVNNILDMSKIEVGKFSIMPEQIELSPLLGVCCDMMEPEANDAAVKIIKDFDNDIPEVMADSRALKQMLINLLSNAIKFSETGKAVTVRSSINGPYIYIDVTDQGIGIAPQDLPKLCNPFVQADNSYKREHEGVGLGLSVVKGLAQLHGGTLNIISQLGVGTTARIELPIEHTYQTDTNDESIEDNSSLVLSFQPAERKQAQS